MQSSVDKSFVMSMEALVMRSIMSPAPKFKKYGEWKQLDGLKLADPEFSKANKIYILLGVDIYGIIIESGLGKGKLNEPIAQNSAA